ncbi:MAG: oxidoreductase [Alphaproteobacteria bacterium]|nr:oxidoreductase [Alphaproteobacteria bacterium]
MSSVSSMFRAITAFTFLLVASEVAVANSLPAPQGRPILEISGSIGTTNAGDKAQFDLAMLQKLKPAKLQTSTAWTEGTPIFEGVLMRELLASVGAKGETTTAAALNDYKIEILIAGFSKYPVVLAFKMDGQELKVRDKGPLWIVYPQDDFPELKNKQTQAKWLWQLKELRVR